MTPPPERSYIVTVAGDEISCRHPRGTIQTIHISDIRRVLVETNDSGPVAVDYWFILEGSKADQSLSFPLGATGEEAVLDRLRQLPGFQIRGMNSVHNARFECWPDPSK